MRSGENVRIVEVNDPRASRASQKILAAAEALRAVLLEDEFNPESSILQSMVATRIDRIAAELVQMSGQQSLFELWVNDAP